MAELTTWVWVQFGKKLYGNKPVINLLIIRHLSLIAKDFCITKHAHGEAMLFLAACYFGIAHFRSEFYTVYDIAVWLVTSKFLWK